MRPTPRFRSLVLAAALAATGCAHSEPLAAPSSPATAGCEGSQGQLTQPAPLRGNAPSAAMAVERQPPATPVDPATVSSQPSALVQKPQPAPAAAPAAQGQATYVAAPPPAP